MLELHFSTSAYFLHKYLNDKPSATSWSFSCSSFGRSYLSCSRLISCIKTIYFCMFTKKAKPFNGFAFVLATQQN